MPFHTGYYAINEGVYYNGGWCFDITGTWNKKEWVERIAELLNKDSRTPPSSATPVAADPPVPAPTVVDEDDDGEPPFLRPVPPKGAHEEWRDYLL